MLMFFTWLLRFACDADLKKPPPKMVPGLHATLTVKLLGLGMEIGSLSIVVLANAWISKRYVIIFAHSSFLNLFFLFVLKVNPLSGPFPHCLKFTSTIIPIFYIFYVCPALLYCWQFFKVCSPISIFSPLFPKCLSYRFYSCFLPQIPRIAPSRHYVIIPFQSPSKNIFDYGFS